MTVTTVHYERKKSDRSYGNRTVALSADLDDGDDPAAAIAQLRAVALAQLDQEEREEEEARQRKHEEDLARYRAEEEEQQRRYQQARAGGLIPEEAVLDGEGEGEGEDEDGGPAF